MQRDVIKHIKLCVYNRIFNNILLPPAIPFTYHLIPTYTSCTNNKRNSRLIGNAVFIQFPK